MIFNLMFLLVAFHSLCDTSLQSAQQAKNKRRKEPIDMSKVPAGQQPIKLWGYSMTHHSFIQGLGVFFSVFIVTGDLNLSVLFGTIEVICHWTIDFLKSECYFNCDVDQMLHLITKFIYAICLFKMGVL